MVYWDVSFCLNSQIDEEKLYDSRCHLISIVDSSIMSDFR